MGLRINTNIAAMNSYRNLSVTEGAMSKSLEKLSSGFRINRAADDAAGLAISEGLRSQIGGLKVAVRNAQDGISVVQTAEGALTEVHAILQRMRDLGVQAGNDSNNAESRANIATEVTQLQGELSRIAESTNFNGTKLLNGSANTLNFQVGAGSTVSDNVITFDFDQADVAQVANALTTMAGDRFTVATPTAVEGTYDFVDSNGATVSVDLGAAGDHTSVDDVAQALNDHDAFAQNFTASVNSSQELVISAKSGGTTTITDTAADTAAGITMVSVGQTAAGISFASAADARASIQKINDQIETVSTARAKLGAVQNRFEHTINNLNVAVENLSASESRIRDTDMAQEMVSFTRAQILSQAGTAMLAQANQAPQGVLRLLQ